MSCLFVLGVGNSPAVSAQTSIVLIAAISLSEQTKNAFCCCYWTAIAFVPKRKPLLDSSTFPDLFRFVEEAGST
jgi:hypothetical protein